MHHAITLGGLLLVLGAIGGLLAAAFGLRMALAGSMSDAPAEGEKAGKQGCITFFVGLAVLVGCILKLVL